MKLLLKSSAIYKTTFSLLLYLKDFSNPIIEEILELNLSNLKETTEHVKIFCTNTYGHTTVNTCDLL